MKKILFICMLSCAVALSVAQLPTSDVLANPLPQGKVIALGKELYIKGDIRSTVRAKAIKFKGVNLTYDVGAWMTAKDYAKLIYRRGNNLVRPHHDTPVSLARRKANMDECYNLGIYTTLDALDDSFMSDKVKAMEGDPAVRARIQTYWRQLKDAGILQHPGLAYVCLINEGATPLRNTYPGQTAKIRQIADSWYVWAKAELRSLGCTALIGDLPDGNIDVELFAPCVAKQDIALSHGYGVHPNGNRFYPLLWAMNGYLWRNNKWWSDSVGNIPCVVQEFGCLIDQDRGLNEAYAWNEVAQHWAGGCVYQGGSNWAQIEGRFDSEDDMSVYTSYTRMVTDVYASLLFRYGQPATKYVNTSLNPLPFDTAVYSRSGPTMTYESFWDRGSATITVNPKKKYVFVFDKTMNRTFQSKDVGGGWQEVLNRGGKEYGWWLPSAVDMATPVSQAFPVNPWTMEREGSCSVIGNKFQPTRAGVFEVILS